MLNALNAEKRLFTTKRLEAEEESIAVKSVKQPMRAEGTQFMSVKNAVESSVIIDSKKASFALVHVTSNIDMANDYKTRAHNYFISRTYYENMVKKGELSQEDFDEINEKLLAKYNISKRSVFNAE